MFDFYKERTSEERRILGQLRVWIAGLAVACLLTGIGIGAMLGGHPAVAQDQLQSARPPETVPASFAEIARRVAPAVVNIETLSAVPEVSEKDKDDKDDPSANNPLFEMFRRQLRRPSRGIGSGFIIDPKGYILTNQHVIDDASRITVSLSTGERFRGKIIGVDKETDLAVIKIDAPGDLPTLKLGDSDAAQVGDWVLAIGSPFGLDQTVTAGIVSKKQHESQSGLTFQKFLQTDAAINRGNSGGPLVNMRGEAIGINSQIATSTGDYNGVGFALPASEAKLVYQQIVASGKVRRGYLGVTLESVHEQFARVYGLPEARGAIIADVAPELGGQPTPAAKIGLQSNDVIVEFNGQPVQDAQDLITKVAGTPVGQTVTIAFLRDLDGKLDRRTASISLGERPNFLAREDDSSGREKDLTPKGNGLRLGLTLTEVTSQLTAEHHLSGIKGLYVKEVDPNGLAADVKPYPVFEGEVITRVNRVPVSTLADFQRVVNSLKPGDAVVLNLSRFDRNLNRMTQRVVQFTYQ
jgi:serine protease Do